MFKMDLKSLSFIMISSFLVAASSLHGVSAAFGSRKALAPASSPDLALPPGSDVDFFPMNTKDPEVIELAKYAIDQHNKENNSDLVFTAVFEALKIKGGDEGTNYSLVVAASNDNKELNDYLVTVSVVNNDKKVISFKTDQ